MAGKCNVFVLNNGLTALHNNASHIYICSAEPTNFADATVNFALGNYNFGPGLAVSTPVNAVPNGSKVTTTAVTAGSVTGTGTASRWAIVDVPNSMLLVDNDLAASQAVTAGNVWSLPAFDFRIPGS